MLAEHTQIDPRHRLPFHGGYQWAAGRQIRDLRHDARRLKNRRLHQGKRHAVGDLEDFPFVRKVGAAVMIVRVDAHLLLATEHQYRRTGHDQRPQCAQFGFSQRVEGVIGGDGRQNAQRIAFGVVQQGGAGHRQIGNAPGAQQVAEVDHALQLPLAFGVALPDRIVVGDVEVHGLLRQLIQQRRQGLLRLGGGGLDADLARAFGEHWQQVGNQCLGVLRVPLQGAFEAGMGEVGQRLIDPGTERAQLGHQPWLHVLEPGQGLAVDIVQQAGANGLPIDIQRQQLLARHRHAHRRHRHATLAQPAQGRMLRLQLDRRVAAMAHLQHIAPLRAVETEVEVLLAAQRLQCAVEAIVLIEQRASLLLAEGG